RPAVIETTALGAAYLAGLAVGYWTNTADISTQWQVEKTFEPNMPRARVQELRARWNEALGRSREWEPHEGTKKVAGKGRSGSVSKKAARKTVKKK
ncbi:MAG TPA: glycerol kinase, partial [Verrucomicrobium sp.]|nr:glycerol kinase [Verrucomicrobium sp.]